MNLRSRNAPPFTLEQGWLYLLGADALGRSILARLVVAAQNTHRGRGRRGRRGHDRRRRSRPDRGLRAAASSAT